MKVRTKYIIKLSCSAAAMLAVMAVIFIFSAQSGQQSYKTSQAVGDFVQSLPSVSPSKPGGTDKGNFFDKVSIRDLAHFALYFALGVTAFLTAASAAGRFVVKRRGLLPLLCACATVAVSFLYALSDEWHQTFVDGRTASMEDVLLDSIGFCTAAVICAAIYWAAAAAKRMKEK